MKQNMMSLIFVFSAVCTFAQTTSTQLNDIRKTELQLQQFSDSITRGSSDAVREASVAAFNPIFLDLLNNPETFQYPFDSLKSISKISSPDGYVRIYSWICPSRSDGTFRYYGIIQKRNPSDKKIKTIGLMETRIAKEEAEVVELKTDTWFGAVYYEIVEKKINKKVHYFLLGWRGNDRLTTSKVIEVLYFDQWENVTFGAPVFVDENKKKKHRVIFEFNAQAVMLLRYDSKKKMIVFDHLSPSSPSAKGQYRYYGPDFTYDGFQFKKGFWNYKSNLDLRNPGDRN